MDYAHRVLHVIFFSRISPVPVREIPGTRLAMKLVLVPRALTLSLENIPDVVDRIFKVACYPVCSKRKSSLNIFVFDFLSQLDE